MKKNFILETFLAMAEERSKHTNEDAKFRIKTERDPETDELGAVELQSIGHSFFCTDLIALAESLQLSCWISTAFADEKNSLYIRIYV